MMTVEITYEKARAVLHKNQTPHGFLATHERTNNYRRIWARDGVVQGIASILAEDDTLVRTFKKHLATLRRYQDATGRIPSNVDTETKAVSYGTHVGKIDATLWYVIGVGEYYHYTKDKTFLRSFAQSLSEAVWYLSCLELNGKGLLYIPTGGDWADEYITDGYILFDQILYYIALCEYEHMLHDLGLTREAQRINHKAQFLKEQISVNYFPSKQERNKRAIYSSQLYAKIARTFNKKHALMSFGSDGFFMYLDCFANSLLLLFDICSLTKRTMILQTIEKQLNKQPVKIVPAFWPPITPNDATLWGILKMNSLFEFRNKPHHYHNGGLWPLVHGFFVAGVMASGKRSAAVTHLEQFSAALARDRYLFHEYIESKTYTPRGVAELGFSAAGYIIAYATVMNNKKVFSI